MCDVTASFYIGLPMPREGKPTRYHCMLYGTYDTLNMFRALLCPPSGGRGIIRRKRDHQDEEGSSGGRGIIRRKRDVPRHSCATSLFLDAHPATLHLTPTASHQGMYGFIFISITYLTSTQPRATL